MTTTLPMRPTALSEPRSRSAPRTGRDQIAPQPDGYYDPHTIEQTMSGSPTVHFHGEDNRTTRYSFAQLPCPELHDPLAAAWATRIGPVGGLRTRSGADNGWNTLKRFLKFLGNHPLPLTSLGQVTIAHFEGFRARELARTTPPQASRELTALKSILRHVPRTELDSAVVEYVSRARESPHPQQPDISAVIGYSDREFMAIMAAARSDVAAIRARLRSSQQLLELFTSQPHTLSAAERERGAELSVMAATGVVPPPLRPSAVSGSVIDLAGWVAKAAELFLTTQDLLPLLVLGVGLSGRNGETIKELAPDHRVLDDRAVVVNILKRRRGKARTRETVHWEGSTKDSELRTPGGFFLLLHELASGSRAFSNSTRVWSIWTRDNFRGPKDFIGTRAAAHGHIDPFELRVSRWLEHRKWISRHGLTADDNSSGPVVLSMNRLKTTVEVRRTRAVGGHLRSASRTNTPDVSFLHYLRSDPRVRDWADEVLTEALHEAEHNAHAFRGRIMGASESAAFTSNPAGIAAELGVSIDQIQRAVNGELDTLVSSCLDFEHSPFVRGGPCAVSFLTCLRCPNALVTERHLPHLFALLDWLQRELDGHSIDDWVGHHGVTWLIITRLILPKFTVAQQERGRAEKLVNVPTDLLDGLRELA